MNWRKYFADSGFVEEQRYKAFKARLMEELRQAQEQVAIEEDRLHNEVMNEVFGAHGQG